MNILLIGCGRIANKHAQAILKNKKKINKLYLCDSVQQKAECIKKLLEKNNFEKEIIVSCDYRNLLNNKDITFCTIATESGLHYKIALDCLTANKHILIEKPLTLSVKEAQKIIDIAHSKNLQTGVCFQNRYNKAVLYLKKAIEQNRFGKINQVTARMLWNRNKEYYHQGTWRGTWEFDGGALMNQSIHNIDIMQMVTGKKCVDIFSSIKNYSHAYIEVEDYATAILNFEDNIMGLIEASTCVFPCNYEETLAVSGEKGFVELGGKALNTIKCWNFENYEVYDNEAMALTQDTIDSVYGEGHVSLYKDFIACVEKNKKFCVSAEEGIKSLKIVLGCYNSALTNSKINIENLDFCTLNMKGFFIK